MISVIYKICLFSSLFMLLTACAQKPTPAPLPETDLPEVTIPGTEIRQITSANTGRGYDLYIRLPNNYDPSRAAGYPVVYLLDAQWDFKMVESIYGCLVYDGFVPELIIVGITYSGKDADYNALRAMDYSPVADKNFKGSGDAPKFYKFITEEVFPLIETEYHVDPSRRVLMGSSFGGTFTLYAMFLDPTLFMGYIATSPVIPYGSGFAIKQEIEYARTHEDLPARLYLGVGEVNDFTQPVENFVQMLKDRSYPSLSLDFRVIEGAGHSSNKPEVYTRGLKFVFQK